MADFRINYVKKSNLFLRLLDATMHLSFGFAIVNVFHYPTILVLMQWIPDFNLLFMWPYSMITRKYLREDNVLVKVHKLFHSLPYLTASLFVLILTQTGDKYSLFIYANWSIHLAIDSFTHLPKEVSNDNSVI